MPVLYGKAASGWSASGKLLTSTQFDLVRPTQAVRLQVDFGDKKAYYYTLQFSLIIPPGLPNGYIVRARAKIDWSVEGNFVHREVTVMNGTVVSGVGQGATIQITDESVAANEVPLIPFEYTATVQVARGTRPTLEHPPIHFPYAISEVITGGAFPDFPPYLIPGGANIAFPVEEGTGITSVFLMASADALIPDPTVILVELTGALQLGFFNWDKFNQWMPLPHGTNRIQIDNFPASPANLRVTPLFGVEG